MRRDRRARPGAPALALALASSLVPGAAVAQTISITAVPDYGVLGHVEGVVGGVDPADHHVAPYIQIEGAGWHTKPTSAQPTVPIAADGSFSADVGTGGPSSLDSRATIFCVALLPAGEAPPPASAAGRIPANLDPLALDCLERHGRLLSFAGWTWAVKASHQAVGPGGNFFSDHPADVFVDAEGLHLRTAFRDGRWWSVEVILLEHLGHGFHVLQSDSRLDALDPNLTFGFFTWDAHGDGAAPADPNREIDVEDSQWGDPTRVDDAQMVVQPYTTAGSLHAYALPDLSSDARLTRWFLWTPTRVHFEARTGHALPGGHAPGTLIDRFTFEADAGASHHVPAAGRERLRLNLWLNGGGAPSDGQPAEVVIRDVRYLPEPGAGGLRGAAAGLLGWLARRRARRAREPQSEPEDEAPWEPDPQAAVEIPIGDALDLHYFPPGDVGDLVDAYLEAAAERGFTSVRIIHGRGRGVQRHRVRVHLARSPHVEAFADAPADRGGWGATEVRLRPPPGAPDRGDDAAPGGAGQAAAAASKRSR